jgi:hypothetical protein
MIGETGDRVAVKAVIDHTTSSTLGANRVLTRVVVETGTALHDVVAWVPDSNVVQPLVPRVEDLIEKMEARARFWEKYRGDDGTGSISASACAARVDECERTVELLQKLLEPDT